MANNMLCPSVVSCSVQQGTGLCTSDISNCAFWQQLQRAESDVLQRSLSGTLPNEVATTLQQEVADVAAALPCVSEPSEWRRRLQRCESLSCDSSLATGVRAHSWQQHWGNPSCSCLLDRVGPPL